MRWTGTEQDSAGGQKLRSGFKPFVDQSSWNFGTLYFPAPLPGCKCRVSFRRYSPLSVEVVDKPNKYKSFLTPIFPGGRPPTVLQQIISAIYCPPFGKVWLSSLCWSPSATPGNDVESRIYIGWVKWRSSLKPFVDQSSWTFRQCRRPLVVVNAVDWLSTSCFVPKIVKVAVSCEVIQKLFLGPGFVRGYPRLWICVFKSQLLSSMRPILVEFCSASWKIRGRKKKKKRKNPW